MNEKALKISSCFSTQRSKKRRKEITFYEKVNNWLMLYFLQDSGRL